MFDQRFKISEVARLAGVDRARFQNWLTKSVLAESDGGYTLAVAELVAVLSEIQGTMREDVARLREIAVTIAAAQSYELSPPAGGWGNARTLHRMWGRARAGEPAWLTVCEQPQGGLEVDAYETLEAVTEALGTREIGAPYATRIFPLHKILGDVGKRFHERHDRLERIGAGEYRLHKADGQVIELHQVEECEA